MVNSPDPIAVVARIVRFDPTDDERTGRMRPPMCASCHTVCSRSDSRFVVASQPIARFNGAVVVRVEQEFCSSSCVLALHPSCGAMLGAADTKYLQHHKEVLARHQQEALAAKKWLASKRLERANRAAVKHLLECGYCGGKGYTTVIEGNTHFTERCGSCSPHRRR